MAGTEPKVDRELLGRVAALTLGQQRWLRTVLQSILTLEAPGGQGDEGPEARPRRGKPRAAAPAPEEERRRKGLDELLRGESGSEEEYPELADELKGIGDIADLLREGGRERRRFGEELMRLFEMGESSSAEEKEEEDEDKGVHFN